jgi:hypothetical protein
MLLSLLAVSALDSSRLSIGTNWSGEEVLHFFSKEAEIDETHRFKIAFRVTGLDEKMWVVERKGELLGSRIMDTEIPPPPDHQPALTKEWVSPAGFLLDADPLDKGQFGLDRLIHFWLPANLPDEWAVELSSAVSHFASKGRAEFKLTGTPSVKSREYDFAYTSPEDPTAISAKGQMWFDVKSGRLIKAKLEAQKAVLPGGVDRANVTLTYTDMGRQIP